MRHLAPSLRGRQVGRVRGSGRRAGVAGRVCLGGERARRGSRVRRLGPTRRRGERVEVVAGDERGGRAHGCTVCRTEEVPGEHPGRQRDGGRSEVRTRRRCSSLVAFAFAAVPLCRRPLRPLTAKSLSLLTRPLHLATMKSVCSAQSTRKSCTDSLPNSHPPSLQLHDRSLGSLELPTRPRECQLLSLVQAPIGPALPAPELTLKPFARTDPPHPHSPRGHHHLPSVNSGPPSRPRARRKLTLCTSQSSSSALSSPTTRACTQRTALPTSSTATASPAAGSSGSCARPRRAMVRPCSSHVVSRASLMLLSSARSQDPPLRQVRSSSSTRLTFSTRSLSGVRLDPSSSADLPTRNRPTAPTSTRSRRALTSPPRSCRRSTTLPSSSTRPGSTSTRTSSPSTSSRSCLRSRAP